MVALRPFTGYVVAAAHAAEVVAPPYDALSEQQRRDLAVHRTDSFLHVLPGGPSARSPGGPSARSPGGPSADGDLRANRAALDRLVAGGRFTPLAAPTLGVLCLEHPGGRTVAVLGDLEVAAFTDGRVLPHERVDTVRVRQLAHHLEVVRIASSPVCVVHRPSAGVTALTERVQATSAPHVAFVATDGVRVTLHLVTDPGVQRALSDAVAAAGQLFVADGHHRAAAVAHAAATAPAARGATDDTAGARPPLVLTAAIPSDQLRVLPFHRRIDHLGVADASRLLGVLDEAGLTPQPLAGAAAPDEPGVVHLTVDGRWWSVDLRGRRVDGPVEGLDVRLVERELLGRLDADADGVEVVAVPAPTGLDTLVRPGSVGLALHPPDIDDVLAVAAAGGVMPAKSTYLVPKLRSGLIVVPR